MLPPLAGAGAGAEEWAEKWIASWTAHGAAYSLRLNHRKVYHRKFDLLSESGSLMWQKSLSNVLDLDSFIAILSNMNLVSDFVR